MHSVHTYHYLELMSATQEVLGYRITETSDTSRHKFNPFHNTKTEIKPEQRNYADIGHVF
jgi:hypothetical protein